MTIFQPLDMLQAIRLTNKKMVATVPIYQDSLTEKPILLWDDIRAVYPEVLYLQYFNDRTSELPFLKGPDSEVLDPRRIAAEPGAIMDAIVEEAPVESNQDPKPAQGVTQWPEVGDKVIPRNPTQGLVETAMENYKDMKNPVTIAQLCLTSHFVSDGYTFRAPSRRWSKIKERSPQVHLDDFAQTLFNARNEDATAQVKLGIMYQEGTGGAEKNLGEAMHWYRRAAEQGNANGQYKVGHMLSHGLGVPQNQELAMGWYKKAAEGGNSDAQNSLGFIYKDGLGLGVTQNFTTAMEWFVKSAEQGNPRGQTSLGLMFKDGHGAPQDFPEAMKWFLKAANEHGHAEAQVEVGMLYEVGGGVRQNYSAAMMWYKKAVDQGYDDAQFRIGDLYCYGQGVPQSFSMARYWYSKAAENGHVEAKENLREIKTFLQGNPQQQPQQPASLWNTIAKLFV
ncbi:hypothetical protein BGZ97_007914 [Linnemannia gamsii]|uniref:HCP-like protein n=1 Tax=Linnemannia gamsii TaxID=64522 RepID=A0A9P6UQY0_9FUNG|nr:hypothetical protein BGZ97_007914 [Linnemannia gamsii]